MFRSTHKSPPANIPKNYGVLTHDIWVMIAQHLQCREVVALLKTSKDMHALLFHDLLVWRPLMARTYQFSPEVIIRACEQYGSYHQAVVAIESTKAKSFIAVKSLQTNHRGVDLLNGYLQEDDGQHWRFVLSSKVYPSATDAVCYIKSIGVFKHHYFIFGVNASTKTLNQWINDKNVTAIKEHVVSVAKYAGSGEAISQQPVKYTEEWGMFSRCPLLTNPEESLRVNRLN